MPYAISVMRELVQHFGCQVHCVRWDKNKKTPFEPEHEKGITFYKRSEFNRESLFRFITDSAPEILIVSGRMDKLYLEAALHFKKQCKVVTGSDNQWSGNRKNMTAALLSPLLYKKYFDYFWVPGPRQYEFAGRMGYPPQNIINHLYTGDPSLFREVFADNAAEKSVKYPHTIAFVGRFAPEKGLDLLTEAFAAAKAETGSDWKLVLVGKGPAQPQASADIEVKDFMTSAQLAKESRNWGVFCLPSLKEPWGVVVHEFAMTGLPLLCADSVGAGDSFLINGYNGYTFHSGNTTSLKQKIVNLMRSSDEQLLEMGRRSYELSLSRSPLIAACSLMSIL